MSYCCHNDCSLIFIEDHAPVTDAKSHTVTSLKALHVTMTNRRKLGKPPVDSAANIR